MKTVGVVRVRPTSGAQSRSEVRWFLPGAPGGRDPAAIAELTAQLQTTNTRLDSVERQLGRIWTFLFLLLGTLVGTLTTLLTTLLLRG